LKVLQLGKFYPPHVGGIESVMLDIVEGLNERNITCDILCSNKKFKYLEEINNKNKIYRTKTYGILFSTSITPQMIKKLKEIIDQYDIIHIHLPDPMANLALFFANPKKQKIIVHWHSDIVKQKILLKFYKPLQTWLLNKADIIICTSKKYAQESPFLHKYRNKCEIVPLCVNVNKFIINDEKIALLKSEYKDKKVIFSLGRLVSYKGFKYLIKAAKYLDESYNIIIGGNGPLKKDLEDCITKNNLSKKVKLLGRISDKDLASYYQLADIFCLPSISKAEAFGIVQIEAMQFKVPVVASMINGSGIDWVNKNDYSGINVEKRNPKSIALGIKKICSTKKIYDGFSERAYLRYLEKFTKDKMNNSIQAIYKKVLLK
tara:strand:- start:2343 stop:3467 length:1125 start_codon:yes stop_codon:yes gene_type:complete